MDKDKLISDLDISTRQLLQQLSFFSDKGFNRQPPDNGWSAAQIGEHLLMLDVIAATVMSGETIPTNRPPDEKVTIIKTAMEDVTKRIAPERVQPSTTGKDKLTLIKDIQQQRDSLKNIIGTTDITDACSSFKHPALGTLTKLEWLYFIIYHTQRHVEQLHQLGEKLYD